MKSGLEGRNNLNRGVGVALVFSVSMKSGLEGRNNSSSRRRQRCTRFCLNEVRPRRPEQCSRTTSLPALAVGLNEVRPRRPEQFGGTGEYGGAFPIRLNEVRPRRPEQSGDGNRVHTADTIQSQ